jgi:hypothetical protein
MRNHAKIREAVIEMRNHAETVGLRARTTRARRLKLDKRWCMVAYIVAIAVFVLVLGSGTVFADGASGGEAAALAGWARITQFLSEWIPRIGGAVMFIGVVMFGMGFRSDDPTMKTNGITTAVGGAIITASVVLITELMK